MIYLDHAATTPPAVEVIAAVTRSLKHGWANAASPHVAGRRVAGEIAVARDHVAALLGTRPSRVVFTSGSTESLNTAIKGCAAVRPGAQIVIGATEHRAALSAARAAAASHGCSVRLVPVNPDGHVDLEEAERLVRSGPCAALVLMLTNNETGVSLVTPAAVGRLGREHGVPTVVDATQSAGRMDLAIDAWELDFVAVSAHKLHGVKGVGALVAPRRLPAGFPPLLHGGDHEGGLRSGTTDNHGVVGFGVAARLARERGPGRMPAATQQLWQRLCDGLGKDSLAWHGRAGPLAPGFLNVRIEGVDADALVATTPEVAFATGSACSSNTPAPSHVLLAMGTAREAADQSVRLTPGRASSEDEIDRAAERIVHAALRLRSMNTLGAR